MKRKLKEGLVQVYTGNGKGKTTAAIGLAVRASGAGLKVYIQQFIKGKSYSEIKAIKSLKNITIEQCGKGCFILGSPEKKDRECALKGLASSRQAVISGKYSLVIMDEINVALKMGLVKSSDVIEIIKIKPRNLELVLTGRYCPSAILKYADLVTEMTEIKHPFKKGILARCGIEY